MSWERIAAQVARRFGVEYGEAFEVVSFVARALRGGGSVGYHPYRQNDSRLEPGRKDFERADARGWYEKE